MGLFGFGKKQARQQEEKIIEKFVEESHNQTVEELPITKIIANRFQPRAVFDEEKIAELSQTIAEHGLIQPIIVREYKEDGYEIIAGERRFRAMNLLKWEKVPAIVNQLSDKEVASIALIENLQREELTAIEEAHAYKRLIALHQITQGELAKQLGKSQSTVANKLRLLKLGEAVQTAALNKQITERHARALIALDEAQQAELLKEIIEHELTVKATENRVQKLLDKVNAPKKRQIKSRDFRIAVNTIKESLDLVNKTGIPVETIENETEEYIEISIKISKNK
ncbi:MULTISPECIES: nucleoid occlusion protein [Brochothrix]|uniref:DNA-binding protein Spo0J-like n=1 Tax=Brochothrix thermosphacta TaxID=2756 RepID=A0A1D2JYU8_BROTH|nr:MULTISPECIES: nucleoid occlusion protein [Brochothrix]SLM93754.1 Chromosome (plasmid) partitioning protein ParB [Brachybacterium faecium]ANZ95152.1 nucleoid occlusion protein [Brochothrix thermosphacta]ANZ96543.1 nucleoid occlusion protein [Brochothrix thermosphacta]ATF25967.1 nucleoid occlusion protein [Brochothrix thermosphacta]MBR5526445.1 nucleoid occlusion protein [Brochothrix sp.]